MTRTGWAPALVVALALGLLPGCGDASDPPAGPPPPGTVILRDIAFKPGKITVKVGDTVTWRFEDKGIPHNVVAEDDSFESETFDTGVFTHTFEKAGTYNYLCTLHAADMKGVITVR